MRDGGGLGKGGGSRDTKGERFKIYFGGRADQTSNGLRSKITSRSLLNPWIDDDIKQIIHNILLAVIIDDMKEKISIFGS